MRLAPGAGCREDSPAVRGKCREATKGDGSSEAEAPADPSRERTESPDQAGGGKAHDIEEITVDAFDKDECAALNPISSGLVHRFSGGDVVLNLSGGKRIEFYGSFLAE